ncbi:MAG: hypothetical protein WA839_07110 [Flavobacteriaceae bacterium]|tara:strand:- start:1506 stop:1796 length:291 start_codon:yes stop_codon:yes gene_type:complete
MNNLITTSKAIAFLSFIIGTILFVFQLYFQGAFRIIYVGLVFIVVAVIINIISLIALIFTLLGNTDCKLEILKACGLILLNIPIAILYFYTLLRYL